MAKRILVLHGPNLNLLGEGAWQGLGTLADLDEMLRTRARAAGLEIKTVQSNHEGALVDALQQQRTWADGVIVAPSSLAASGCALKEALALLQISAVEVRFNVKKGEKSSSIFGDVCSAVVTGRPDAAYGEALDKLRGAPVKDGPAVVKTIGKRKTEPEPPRSLVAVKGGSSGEGKSKTLGPAKKSAVPSKSLTRAVICQQIGMRLRGELSPGALAAWAREKWLAIERGGAAEAGQREVLEEALQQLAVSATGSSRLSDDALIAMMARLS